MGEKTIIRVVVDTNVIVSGLLFGGIPGKIIQAVESNTIQLLITSAIVSEYIKVLSYPKFELTEDDINYLLYQVLLPHSDIVSSTTQADVIIPQDPSDDEFLLCAQQGKADYLISGDAHLTSLGKYQKTAMVTPAAFIKTLGS
jgi:putative PIN family toxin of toxin-antitoxin system